MSAVIKAQAAKIRPMEISDLKAVIQVERAAYDFPWTESIFRDCLRVGYYCCVVQEANAIVGHGIMSYAVGECHLLNVCIHPNQQRKGLGRRLVQHLLQVARKNRSRVAFLEVRVTNEIAYHLYQDLGFSEVGIRKGYYPAIHGREDAMILALDLDEDVDRPLR